MNLLFLHAGADYRKAHVRGEDFKRTLRIEEELEVAVSLGGLAASCVVQPLDPLRVNDFVDAVVAGLRAT